MNFNINYTIILVFGWIFEIMSMLASFILTYFLWRKGDKYKALIAICFLIKMTGGVLLLLYDKFSTPCPPQPQPS